MLCHLKHISFLVSQLSGCAAHHSVLSEQHHMSGMASRISVVCSITCYTPAPPKVEWEYTGFTPMSVHPSICRQEGFQNFLKKLLAQFISYLAFTLKGWVSWPWYFFVFLASFSALWRPNIWPKTRTRTNLFHLKNMEQCNTTSFI